MGILVGDEHQREKSIEWNSFQLISKQKNVEQLFFSLALLNEARDWRLNSIVVVGDEFAMY